MSRRHHLVVIEGEHRELVQREPADALAVLVGAEPEPLGRYERVVGDRDHPLPRIPVRRAEGVELLEIDAGDAGAFFELAARVGLDVLVLPDDPAGQRPVALEGVVAPAHQQQLEPLVAQAEHHDVGGQHGAPRVGGEGHVPAFAPG